MIMRLKILLPLFFIAYLQSATYPVPQEYPSIQSAINAAAFSGDTVLVSPGIYVENIDFYGKDIFLTSHYIFTEHDSTIRQTVIDGGRNGAVVTVENGETRQCVINGFTITNGSGKHFSFFSHGGGLYIEDSSPTIINCIIKNNYVTAGGSGGGMLLKNSGSYLSNLIITCNLSNRLAGGIFISNSYIEMDSVNRCSVFQNQAAEYNDICNNFNSEVEPAIYLDTATVSIVDDYFIGGNFETVDILNGKVQPAAHDLYVSPEGDNANSGISPAVPLKTIVHALNIIQADSLNPLTIHLLPGVYSPSSGQVFPLNLRSYVSLLGSGSGQTVIDMEESVYLLMAGFNYEKNITLGSMSIVNGTIIDENHPNTLIRFIQNSDLIISNTTFRNNRAQIIDTASLQEPGYFPETTSFLMKNCNFINNVSTVWAGSLVDIDIIDCNFYWDHQVDSSSGSMVVAGHNYYFEHEYTRRIEGCRFTRNMSTTPGIPGGVAGLYIYNAKYPVEVVNCTFADNSTLEGGSIFVDNYENAWYGFTSDVLLINSIIWNPQSADEIVFYEVFQNPERSRLILANNNIRNGADGIQLYGDIDVMWDGGNISVAPLFTDPENNDYTLQEGSPCIDAGTALYVFEGDTILNLSPDQYRGIAPDIGAFEYDFQPDSVPGDLNLDTELNILDIIILVEIILEITLPDENQQISGDVNSDGVMDILDILALVELIMG